MQKAHLFSHKHFALLSNSDLTQGTQTQQKTASHRRIKYCMGHTFTLPSSCGSLRLHVWLTNSYMIVSGIIPLFSLTQQPQLFLILPSIELLILFNIKACIYLVLIRNYRYLFNSGSKITVMIVFITQSHGFWVICFWY